MTQSFKESNLHFITSHNCHKNKQKELSCTLLFSNGMKICLHLTVLGLDTDLEVQLNKNGNLSS
jgi:hypothetical protein